MNVIEIVKAALVAEGYDGLAGDDCGCGLDDLMPCDWGNATRCVPAHAYQCDSCPWPYDPQDEWCCDKMPGGHCWRGGNPETAEVVK